MLTGKTQLQVMDLIPVKPIGDSRQQITDCNEITSLNSFGNNLNRPRLYPMRFVLWAICSLF